MKKYILIYIDPVNPSLSDGDTEVVAVGTFDECQQMALDERFDVKNSEDERIKNLFLFEVGQGYKVEFIFPKPEMKII